MKASTWLNIVFNRLDIVETCSSSPIVFPMMSHFAKALGMTPKTWLPPKNAAIDTPPLTQGCLLHTLNESFSQLVPDQDDLLILKTLFPSQDWIHRKHKYFLCDDLRNLPFLHTLCVIPYFFVKDSNGLLQKCFPPSLIMARGIPNRLKIFYFKNFITVLWSLFQLGIASIHFET